MRPLQATARSDARAVQLGAPGAWSELSMVPFVLRLGRCAMLPGAGAREDARGVDAARSRADRALGALWALTFVGGAYVAG